MQASHHIQQGQAAFASGAYGEATTTSARPCGAHRRRGRGTGARRAAAPAGMTPPYTPMIGDPLPMRHAAYTTRGEEQILCALGRIEAAEKAWAAALQLDPSLTWMREGSKND